MHLQAYQTVSFGSTVVWTLSYDFAKKVEPEAIAKAGQGVLHDV